MGGFQYLDKRSNRSRHHVLFQWNREPESSPVDSIHLRYGLTYEIRQAISKMFRKISLRINLRTDLIDYFFAGRRLAPSGSISNTLPSGVSSHCSTLT